MYEKCEIYVNENMATDEYPCLHCPHNFEDKYDDGKDYD